MQSLAAMYIAHQLAALYTTDFCDVVVPPTTLLCDWCMTLQCNITTTDKTVIQTAIWGKYTAAIMVVLGKDADDQFQVKG